MILTDEEIVRATHGTGSTKLLMTIARRIEAAVLEKLRQQEPAAFAILSDSGNAVRIWWSGAERARAERIAAEDFPGMPLVALSAAPVPAAAPDDAASKCTKFIDELRQLCLRHKVTLAVSGYDSIQVWDIGECESDPIYANGIDDRTKQQCVSALTTTYPPG